MCGIAGIYICNRNKSVLLDVFNPYQVQQVIGHRGPDDKGIEVLSDNGLVLVHTRLSVIDLSEAGHQPMFNDDKSVGIIFNGEIYNFLELRHELEKIGIAFRSRTDTEVILRGYELWGIEVVSRLNGMFAFALWDGRKRCLWLVRDRLGKKPLYYWYDEGRGILLFASELKALLTSPLVRPPEVSREALHCYLSLGYVPAPYTMFRGVWKLPAAHWLRCDEKGLEICRYWDVPALGTWKASYQEYCQAIRDKIEQAVNRRLISDVPLGAFLSGGVDSSIVVGIMSKLMKEPVRTFSAAFDVGTRSFKYNVDADTAEVVSKIFGTCHTRLVIRPTDSLLEHLKEVIWYMDEPHANPTLVSTYLLARSVKEQGITVILSGDGGDELFGGYSRYLADRWVSFLEKVPKSIRHAVLTISRHISRAERLNKALKKADFAEGSPQRYLTWWEQFPIPERLAILTPPWYEGIDTPTQCVEAAITRFPTAAWQEILSYADLTLWIAEESNMRVDKMSMAHAVEVRAPFLDYTLVELAMSIPFDRKVSWTQGKLLLKDAFRDLLPNIVLKRPKWGWFSPVYYWVNDLLWDEAKALITWLPQTGIFSQTVTELLNTYPTQNPQKIWSLIIFALWYQRYILQDV